MNARRERRREPRIKFHWPLWFGYNEDDEMFRGQVVNVSRSGVSFSIENHLCPSVGCHLLTRFSYPHNLESEFLLDTYFFWAEVIRIDPTSIGTCRVALRLHRSVNYEPVADINTELLTQIA